ncbi:TIGR02281 family clan AA aspartic protease [Brevundimonas sp.]|uniref:retropepsin-like aspartic protease family protein n=1 Tax=Brevundimonas sp. TaxID=1871086 RepID=UPI0025EC6A3F|nr:TIGR02281 family clan AA aspartic protease [Brevundimonas sp.]
MLKSAAIVSAAVIAALSAAGGVMAVDREIGREAVIPMASDGHFWALGHTGAGEIRFLVDTGATRVSLTREDAERLGIALQDDAFTEVVRTPSGEVRAAPVRLDWLAVGPARVEQVHALVFEDGLGASLLGMSYLARLERFRAEGGSLKLSG